MVNICDSLQLKNFLQRLEQCEKNLHLLSPWEVDYVQTIRRRFEDREHMVDIGVTPWNPTTKQWNLLDSLAGKCK